MSAVLLLMAFVIPSEGQTVYAVDDKPTTVQLRTNAIYWLALSPNISVELQTNLGMAFVAEYTGAWWNDYTRNRFFRNYIFQTEGRYYLDKGKMNTPYYGHHIGIYGQMGTYDFEFGGRGRICRDLEMTFGVGISYGYSIPVSRHFNIDLTVGIGYLHSRYDEYMPAPDSDSGYRKIETRKLNFLGPTKLEASLVWNINTKNEKGIY